MPQFALKEAFNRYFLDGCSTFTKHEVIAYGAGDRKKIETCLLTWELNGFLHILKPFDQAMDGEVMIKVLKRII